MAGQQHSTDAQLPEVCVPEIDRCVQTELFHKTFSAAAVVASRGDEIFHRKVYGTPSQPPPFRKLGFDTYFDLASLTKPLGSGLAALALAARNRIDLNARVSRTIPEFRSRRFEGMTIDMLLDHTSGFPAYRSYWQELKDADAERQPSERVLGTRAAVDAFKRMVAETTLEYEPGKKVLYSDIGFMALGWIIEGIVGKPLDAFVEQDVFRELGIQRELFFAPLDEPRWRMKFGRKVFAATEECPWREKLLQGEVHDPNAWAMGGVAGHAGLFGTADGVWKLTHALWASYSGQRRDFLGGTVRRFWTKSRRLRQTTRTLAWDTPSAQSSAVGKRFSMSSVGHLGFTGCSVWIDLSTDIIGVVLTNAAHPSTEGKQEALAKFRPRIYEHIAKSGEAMGAGDARGSAAFSKPNGGRPSGSGAFGR